MILSKRIPLFIIAIVSTQFLGCAADNTSNQKEPVTVEYLQSEAHKQNDARTRRRLEWATCFIFQE